MKTITLFNAYAKAQENLSDACVDIVQADIDKVRPIIKRARRWERQCKTLERAVRARLAAQCQNADYADDLADDDDSATGQVLAQLKG